MKTDWIYLHLKTTLNNFNIWANKYLRKSSNSLVWNLNSTKISPHRDKLRELWVVTYLLYIRFAHNIGRKNLRNHGATLSNYYLTYLYIILIICGWKWMHNCPSLDQPHFSQTFRLASLVSKDFLTIVHSHIAHICKGFIEKIHHKCPFWLTSSVYTNAKRMKSQCKPTLCEYSCVLNS